MPWISPPPGSRTPHRRPVAAAQEEVFINNGTVSGDGGLKTARSTATRPAIFWDRSGQYLTVPLRAGFAENAAVIEHVFDR